MTDHPCPDAAVLAAFAEGALPPEQRAEVECHVADCPECPAIVGEVTRFLADEEPQPQAGSDPVRPRHRWWFVAAAVAALCIPAVALWRTESFRDPLSGIRRIAARSPERTFEGRLHGFPHARFRSPRGSEHGSVPTALAAEAKRLAERTPDAAILHARGIAALLSHDPAEAVSLLSAATRVHPRDAAIWSDLAAAELARASRGDRSALVLALQAALRASALDPAAPDAHYNRALALEHLGRDGEAVAAYRQALTHETSDAWRTEMRERLQRLESGN